MSIPTYPQIKNRPLTERFSLPYFFFFLTTFFLGAQQGQLHFGIKIYLIIIYLLL